MDYKNLIPNGASYEILTERMQENTVKFDGNKFESFAGKDTTNQVARVLYDGKLSIASGTKPNSNEELIKQAAEMVPYGSEHDVDFVGSADIKPMDLSSDETISPKEMADIAGGLLEDLCGLDSRISTMVSVTSKASETTLKTSNGFNASYKKTNWNLTAGIDITVDGDNLSVYDFQIGKNPKFDPPAIKEKIMQKLQYAKNVVPLKAGTYPVIFSPGEVNYVTFPIIQSLFGNSIYQKVSPFCDKLGEELFDKRFTFVDDGSLEGEWTSLPFDSEGTPVKRNVLVQDGKLQNYILDRKFGARLGKNSTGNSRGPNHLRITPGEKKLAEMIKSIDYGLLIDGSMGAWSGNPYSGIVSGTISMGLLIENGQIKGRVKDSMFTINAFEHLQKHLLDLSAETEGNGFMCYNVYPYMMLDQVVISAN